MPSTRARFVTVCWRLPSRLCVARPSPETSSSVNTSARKPGGNTAALAHLATDSMQITPVSCSDTFFATPPAHACGLRARPRAQSLGATHASHLSGRWRGLPSGGALATPAAMHRAQLRLPVVACSTGRERLGDERPAPDCSVPNRTAKVCSPQRCIVRARPTVAGAQPVRQCMRGSSSNLVGARGGSLPAIATALQSHSAAYRTITSPAGVAGPGQRWLTVQCRHVARPAGPQRASQSVLGCTNELIMHAGMLWLE